MTNTIWDKIEKLINNCIYEECWDYYNDCPWEYGPSNLDEVEDALALFKQLRNYIENYKQVTDKFLEDNKELWLEDNDSIIRQDVRLRILNDILSLKEIDNEYRDSL